MELLKFCCMSPVKTVRPIKVHIGQKNRDVQYTYCGAQRLRGVHCKKEVAIFPSPAGMSMTKLSLGGKKLNYSRPGRV